MDKKHKQNISLALKGKTKSEIAVKERNCLFCSDTFKPRSSKGKFCSHKCYSANKKGKVIRWLKDKEQPTGENAHHWKGGKPKCADCKKQLANRYAKWCVPCRSKALSGENNWKWVSDRTKLVQSEKKHLDGRYREWMRAVKNRDGWKCKISNGDCSGRLEAHHILVWRSHPELRYEVNNGITLCCYHHPRKESEEKRLIPIFRQLLKTN